MGSLFLNSITASLLAEPSRTVINMRFSFLFQARTEAVLYAISLALSSASYFIVSNYVCPACPCPWCSGLTVEEDLWLAGPGEGPRGRRQPGPGVLVSWAEQMLKGN